MGEFVFSANEIAVLETLRARGLATIAQVSVLALLPPSSVHGEPMALSRRGTQIFAAPIKVASETRGGGASKSEPDPSRSVVTGSLDDTLRIRVKPSVATVMPSGMQEDDQRESLSEEVTP
jgi:hypothetical protein